MHASNPPRPERPTRPGPPRALLLVAAALSLAAPRALAAEHPLRVHPNKRYLVQADGQPFFYLGDTAWELLHRLDRDETDRYLRDRARKGFTVIQTVILAELDGLTEPNAQGDLPLHDQDPEKPNEKYFQHVDWVVARAAELGLTLGLLPTWGDKLFERHVFPGPRVFNPRNARSFGAYVGKRYAGRPIIWILGGDRNPASPADLATTRALAEGLRSADKSGLITFHPRGPGRSSDYFHKDAWLSFNMVQSSHAARGFDNGAFIDHDYALRPPKPTLDGEPRYEALVAGFYWKDASSMVRFDDTDAREAAYRALLAGAAGHTYGNGNIWQMWSPKHKPVLGANIPWNEALDHPGSFQMGHLRRLFESRPFTLLVPDQALIVKQPGGEERFVRAARASDGSFAFVYVPQGDPVTVDIGRMKAVDLDAHWFDPRYGIAYHLHRGEPTSMVTFVPPTRGRGQDWVLVLDAKEKGYPAPGAARAEARP